MTSSPVLLVTNQGERGELFFVTMRVRGLGEKRSSARPLQKYWSVHCICGDWGFRIGDGRIGEGDCTSPRIRTVWLKLATSFPVISGALTWVVAKTGTGKEGRRVRITARTARRGSGCRCT